MTGKKRTAPADNLEFDAEFSNNVDISDSDVGRQLLFCDLGKYLPFCILNQNSILETKFVSDVERFRNRGAKYYLIIL